MSQASAAPAAPGRLALIEDGAADAQRRLEAQMNTMRFQQQRLWMFPH
jgi:hypothetical protein